MRSLLIISVPIGMPLDFCCLGGEDLTITGGNGMEYDRMNETDVREVVVRPFLEKLGYKFGTEAHIRTEVSLRYSRAYLGRKDPKKDFPLQGRADYICEVIPHGRWVVEVKAPSVELSIDDSEQAHTYATHPEIGAFFYLITNGRDWQLFRIGEPKKSILSWENEQTDNIILTIANILGPDAFKRRAKHYEIDIGKPLGLGLGSNAEIKGGFATYSETKSSNPQMNAAMTRINGSRAPVTHGKVYRLDNGAIEANIGMLSISSAGDNINSGGGMSELYFRTKDEFISIDRDNPTIFTNLVKIDVNQGDRMPEIFGNPSFIMPFKIETAAFTQAVGFIEDGRFKGTFEVSYLYDATVPSNSSFQVRAMAQMFMSQNLTTIGDFDLHIV